MVVEIEPGSGSEHVEAGHRFPLSQTEPSIQFEAFLSTLDTDTQQYLQLLVAGGAQGIGGRGRQLSATPSAACSPSPTTSPNSTAPSPSAASRWPG